MFNGDQRCMSRGEMRDFIRNYINYCDVLGLSYAVRNNRLWEFGIGKTEHLPHELVSREEVRLGADPTNKIWVCDKCGTPSGFDASHAKTDFVLCKDCFGKLPQEIPE